jgi:DNA-binding XRE family transcriptional regulator
MSDTITIESRFSHELGRNIESKRKACQWRQQDLAVEIGVHRNTLMRWEEGLSECPMLMMLRICDTLGCNHLSVLPGKEFTWGAYREAQRERDMKRRIRYERDPPLRDKEIMQLTRRVA